ncbi:MAG: hypothetical protein HN584_05340 [Akkermansiaceae bacterium]|nr:hypothetical protein [Akkermansiaceae bacterium]
MGPRATDDPHRRDRAYRLPTHSHCGELCRGTPILHFATVPEPVTWILARPRSCHSVCPESFPSYPDFAPR